MGFIVRGIPNFIYLIVVWLVYRLPPRRSRSKRRHPTLLDNPRLIILGPKDPSKYEANYVIGDEEEATH